MATIGRPRDAERTRRVLETFAALCASEPRPPSVAEVAAAAGCARSTTNADLRRLARAGRVTRLGGPRGYVPAPKGDAVQ